MAKLAVFFSLFGSQSSDNLDNCLAPGIFKVTEIKFWLSPFTHNNLQILFLVGGQIKFSFLFGCKVHARKSDIVYLKLLRQDFFCSSCLLFSINEFRFNLQNFLCNINFRLKEVFLHYKYDKTQCLVRTIFFYANIF